MAGVPIRSPTLLSRYPELMAHRRALNRCIGTACFAALAVHFNIFSPLTLEERIDGRRKTKALDRTGTNIYRRWFRDGVWPSDKTAEKLFVRTSGQVDLRYWRDHMLWRVLVSSPSLLESRDKT